MQARLHAIFKHHVAKMAFEVGYVPSHMQYDVPNIDPVFSYDDVIYLCEEHRDSWVVTHQVHGTTKHAPPPTT